MGKYDNIPPPKKGKYDDIPPPSGGKYDNIPPPSSGSSLSDLDPTNPTGGFRTASDAGMDIAMMGYLPQVQGVAETGIDKLARLLGKAGVGHYAEDEKLKNQGFDIQGDAANYTNNRDRQIAEQAAREKENPNAALAGKAAGIGASVVLPGAVAKAGIPGISRLASLLNPAKAEGVLGTAAAGLKSGALSGALYNPGDVAGEVNPLQLLDRTGNALVGGAISGGIPLVVGGASKLASGAADKMSQYATGASRPKDYIPGVGLENLDNGIWGRKSSMRNAAQDVLRDRGGKLDDVVSKLTGEIDSAPVAQEIAAVGEPLNFRGQPKLNTRAGARLVDAAQKDVAARGNVLPTEALQLSRDAGKIGYNHGDPLNSVRAAVAQAEQRGYSQALKNASPEVAPLQKAIWAAKKAEKHLGKGSSVLSPQTLIPLAMGLGGGATQFVSGKEGERDPMESLLAGLGTAAISSPAAISSYAKILSKIPQTSGTNLATALRNMALQGQK